MKANIVCDDYKEEAFKKMLTENKFMFSIHPGITKRTRQILVFFEEHQREGLAILIKDVDTKTTRRKK